MTGTGTPPEFKKKLGEGRRPYRPSAAALRTDRMTEDQAPGASRQPREKTKGDEKARVQHKIGLKGPDKGKGDAGENPMLPSHKVRAYIRMSRFIHAHISMHNLGQE